MIAPEPELMDRMSDAVLKNWLIEEGGYDAEAAEYLVEVLRGRESEEGLE